MEPVVDAAIIRSNAAKDSSSQKPKPKSLEDALVRKREKTNLDPKSISSQQDGDSHHTPEAALSDHLVKRSEHLEDPHGTILRRLHFESDRIDKCDADQESEEEEEEEESRSVLDSDNERLLESGLSENGLVCAEADGLLIGFSAVSIGDEEDELCPAAAYDDIYDLLLIPDEEEAEELCPAPAAAFDDIYDLLLIPAEDDDELLLADGFETPIAMPSSPDCGTAKVCPSAPMKPGMGRRNFKNMVDSSICKKLQF